MDEQKIYVIPNGSNYVFPKKKIKSQKKINIIFLGNFIRSKGIIDFMNSFTFLSYELLSKIKILLAGNWVEDDTENEIKKIIKNNKNIPFKVIGPLEKNKKLDFLINADIMVYPTYHDAHPWVIIESIAAGLPIITTDQGAIKECVKNNYNGFIVDKRNPKQISEKVTFLIDNSEQRFQMGINSKKHYKKYFTEEKLVENFSTVFNEILNLNV